MEKQNVMTPRTLDDFLQDRLQNPQFAAEYLNTFLEDGTPEEIATAMTDILSARTHSNFKSSFEPVVKQIQEFMQSTGLRWSAQPMS
ncbi:MAG TPA: hypothetical protein VGM92_01085 [Candidatus Kapabacteria bacterium]|jgi:DNA-binding phage protein